MGFFLSLGISKPWPHDLGRTRVRRDPERALRALRNTQGPDRCIRHSFGWDLWSHGSEGAIFFPHFFSCVTEVSSSLLTWDAIVKGPSCGWRWVGHSGSCFSFLSRGWRGSPLSLPRTWFTGFSRDLF